MFIAVKSGKFDYSPSLEPGHPKAAFHKSGKYDFVDQKLTRLTPQRLQYFHIVAKASLTPNNIA